MLFPKNIIYGLCIWLLACRTTKGGDIDCHVDCACCKNRLCGPGRWFPYECTEGCIDGYTGPRCYRKCPHINCKNCGQIDSSCDACYDGYYLGPARDCSSKCLHNCKTCTSGSICTSCKEEYFNDNGSNDCRYRKCPIYCQCENDHCTSCKGGFYNTSDLCNRLCPSNCVTCSSSRDCESCTNGQYNGYQYDDSSLPLLNDCSYKCRDNCMQCSTYNVCSVCKTGFYGPLCKNSCSTGCIAGICDTQTGICRCNINFVGAKCDKCQNGKYGDMCDKQCSIGCKGNAFEKKSGNCIHGCIIDTIVGDKCDVCSTGWYGLYCNIFCSVGCKNNSCTDTIIDSGSTEQPQNTATVVLGIIFAISMVGYFILVVVMILRKLRQRKSTGRPIYENTDVELTCDAKRNMKDSLNTSQASNINDMAKSRDYEDLGGVQVTEHEYGQIRIPA